MDPITLTAIATAISGGAALAGGVQQEQARQKADNEAGRMADKRKQAEDAAAAQLRDEEAKATANAQREQQAAAMRASRKSGRAGTILTGALGAPSAAAPAKTLLGQ